MRSILLQIATVLISSFEALPQEYLLEFEKYNSKYSFDFRGMESIDAIEIKGEFEKFIHDKDLLIGERKSAENYGPELFYRLKALDLNDDEKTDIIYQGGHMGEGQVIHIYIQTESGFMKVFTSAQGIVKVNWVQNKLSKIYIHDWGCCDDPNLENEVYKVTWSDVPSFELIWKSIEIREYLTKPKTYFANQIRFEILNESYNLRALPTVEAIPRPLSIIVGNNIIGLLKKGYRGTAYAEYIDGTGRVWWYVLVDRDYQVMDSYINYSMYDFKPHLVGWISNRFVKKLE